MSCEGASTLNENEALPSSRPPSYRSLQAPAQLKKKLALSCLVMLVITPGVLAAVGAIIDHRIFGSHNPNFHVQFLPYSAFVASPCVVLRWCFVWKRGERRSRLPLEFLIYLLQTGGLLAAYMSALVGGKEAYHAVEHMRNFFSADGSFQKIRTADNVYRWLDKVMTNIYSGPDIYGKSGGRTVAGRTVIFSALRLRQNRVKGQSCPSSVKYMGLTGFQECFLAFSKSNEERRPYSTMNFTWTNLPYKNYVGYTSMDDVTSTTPFNVYPLAGYWTFFSIDATLRLVRNQIQAMKRAKWIDKQTRLVVLDFGIQVPETKQPLWGEVEFSVEILQTGQFIPNTPTIILNSLPKVTRRNTISDNAGPAALRTLPAKALNMSRNAKQLPATLLEALGGGCEVLVGTEYYVPFYLGVLSVAIYTAFQQAISLCENWRRHLKRIFTYTEVLFVIFISISWGFRLSADALSPCSVSYLLQVPFVSSALGDDFYRTAIVSRFEPQMMAIRWQDARHLFALALFVHFFNILKFLVNFAKLGELVRTIKEAAPELASFSLSFAVIFIAFCTMFFTLFSMQAEEYSTFLRSVSSLWLGMLGEISMTKQLWAMKEWAVPRHHSLHLSLRLHPSDANRGNYQQCSRVREECARPGARREDRPRANSDQVGRLSLQELQEKAAGLASPVEEERKKC